jgi:putative CRISPR-associated protein (TIGR02620 family)
MEERKMDNAISTNKREVFIAVNRLVKGSQPLFVGPFRNVDEAQMIIDQAISDNQEIVTDSVKPATKTALRAEILGKTEARKLGMRSENMGDKNTNLYQEIPSYDTWDHIEIDEKPHRGRPRKTATSVNVAKPSNIVAPERHAKVARQVYSEPKSVSSKKIIIVEKYPGMKEWLLRRGIQGESVDHVYSPQQIRDAIVIGGLPIPLAAYASVIGIIDMPRRDRNLRGQELTADQMDEAGAEIQWYIPPQKTDKSPL